MARPSRSIGPARVRRRRCAPSSVPGDGDARFLQRCACVAGVQLQQVDVVGPSRRSEASTARARRAARGADIVGSLASPRRRAVLVDISTCSRRPSRPGRGSLRRRRRSTGRRCRRGGPRRLDQPIFVVARSVHDRGRRRHVWVWSDRRVQVDGAAKKREAIEKRCGRARAACPGVARRNEEIPRELAPSGSMVGCLSPWPG